ncbi:dual specificity phosphatase catalytic domain protein [Sutterella sp. CAG:351]|nr:dual specificity phosphatase catalytic domain protein [Sutterella sp. CAG:351]
MVRHFLRCHIAEIELQAAGQHRDRHLLRICRRKNEFDVLGRLFQRLQHGIEGRAGKLMHFVDHINLEAGVRRRVHSLLKQCRHLIHASVARRVHFDVIDEMPLIYRAACFTDAAGLIGNITLAVRTRAVEAFR